MQHSIFVVGENLKFNTLLLDSIFEKYEKYTNDKPNIFYCQKTSNKLFMLLENQIQSNDILTILASNDSFNLVSKVLCTLSEDVMELKHDCLLPSKALKYEKDTYLLKIAEKKINVLKINENEKIPNFLFDTKTSSKIFYLIGMDKDSCKILLAPLEQTYDIKITVTQLIEGWLLIKATSSEHGTLEPFLKGVKSLFPSKMINADDYLSYIVQKLKEHNKTITFAESCTGGLLASKITKISGSSNVFNGSLVTYANKIKSSWLGVDTEILKNYGAVSEQCVREMLQGALTVSKASFGIAVSGIAGPNGGTQEKPVGTVFIGVANEKSDFKIERLMLSGDRKYIQEQSALHALKLLLELENKIFF